MTVTRGIQLESKVPTVKIKRSRKPSKIFIVKVYGTGYAKRPEWRDFIAVRASTKREAIGFVRQKMIEYYGKARAIESIEEATPEFIAKYPVVFRKSFPRRNPEDTTMMYVEVLKVGNKWTTKVVDYAGRSRCVSEHFKKSVAMKRAYNLADYYHVRISTPNPGEAWHKSRTEDLRSLERTQPKADLKIFLQGQASESEHSRRVSHEKGIPNPNLKEALKKGEYYADYDEETGFWGIFHTDYKSGHMFESYSSEDDAKARVKILNTGRYVVANPNIKEALEAVKRVQADTKAGHTDAVEFWKGYASGALVSNPKVARVADIPNKITVNGKELEIMAVRHSKSEAISDLKDLSFGGHSPELTVYTTPEKEVFYVLYGIIYRNPILPELGAGIVAGAGLGMGFKAVDLGAKWIERRLGRRKKK